VTVEDPRELEGKQAVGGGGATSSSATALEDICSIVQELRTWIGVGECFTGRQMEALLL